MWPRPRTDLKLRLALQIAAVAAICFVAAAAYALVDIDRDARAQLVRTADIAAKDLELQRSKMDWVKGQPLTFPDLQNAATALTAPGLCIAFRQGGEILQRFCGSAQSQETGAPGVFGAIYLLLFDPGQEAVRPVLFRNQPIGEAVAWVDLGTLTAQAWREARRLFAAMGVTLLLLCGLVYAALARALRPTRLIRAGLERIAAGDLSARLPPFDLAELSAVRDVFNHLAETLERTLDERSALTRRLIALQDDERRRLAGELHDEFGQYLAAIRAQSASAAQTAARRCPDLLQECESIERTAAHMAATLRGALFRLRPPDVEELGLAASLEGLVAGWNSRCRGRTRFAAVVEGEFDALPAGSAESLYRIAQEALTNAAKHADATQVVLRLTLREAAAAPSDAGGAALELVVADDGRASERGPVRPGMGFLAMRERVAALGGSLSFEPAPGGGSELRVVIPALPVAQPGGAERAA